MVLVVHHVHDGLSAGHLVDLCLVLIVVSIAAGLRGFADGQDVDKRNVQKQTFEDLLKQDAQTLM